MANITQRRLYSFGSSTSLAVSLNWGNTLLDFENNRESVSILLSFHALIFDFWREKIFFQNRNEALSFFAVLCIINVE